MAVRGHVLKTSENNMFPFYLHRKMGIRFPKTGIIFISENKRLLATSTDKKTHVKVKKVHKYRTKANFVHH